MPSSNLKGWRRFLRKGEKGRFGRLNIVVAILLAGWVPSISMLFFSYTILTNTLESKILRDRQTFVQLIAHLVGDDFSRTGGIIEYYQTQPEVAQLLTGPQPEAAGQLWLSNTFYSHPRIDGMFLAGADGRLIASIPAVPPELAPQFPTSGWLVRDSASSGAYVSPIHPRLSDKRMSADIIGPVQAPDGTLVGYLGVSVLVERMGRRLSSIEFADQSICQVIDQTGAALFTNKLQPNDQPVSAQASGLIQDIRRIKTGHLERFDNLYSFSLIETTGWVAVV